MEAILDGFRAWRAGEGLWPHAPGRPGVRRRSCPRGIHDPRPWPRSWLPRRRHCRTSWPAAASRSVRKIAFHAPCSLQHGQKVRGVVGILGAAGYSLTPVAPMHIFAADRPAPIRCCSHPCPCSYGPTSCLPWRPGRPEPVVSANIRLHRASGSRLEPTRSTWIELIDEKITKRT